MASSFRRFVSGTDFKGGRKTKAPQTHGVMGRPVEQPSPENCSTSTLGSAANSVNGPSVPCCSTPGTGIGALWLAVHWLLSADILSLMASTGTFDQSRRSTRVALKVVIAIGGGAGSRTCEGETIVVSLLGALIATTCEFTVGMRQRPCRPSTRQAP
jgi:hypothetical protein